MEMNFLSFYLMLICFSIATIIVYLITKDCIYKKKFSFKEWKISDILSYVCVVGVWLCMITNLYKIL